MRKIIITAALTGGTHDKAANPSLPEQPNEIIEQALQCRDAGAAIVHIHARDKQGKPTADLNIFREILDGITRSSDLIAMSQRLLASRKLVLLPAKRTSGRLIPL